MKFTIKEIKLWFNKPVEPKILKFKPNKINVITGDSSTGKSSILRVINYCFLSDRSKIVQDVINENIQWYSLAISIHDKQYVIARKSPTVETVSSEVYFEERDSFPEKLYSNIDINELKSILDIEFGITDDVRFPLGKDVGTTDFLLSFRYFLLFNCLTEDIIGTSSTYFDTSFFGKKEYDEALSHIFNMVIGVDDMKDVKAQEKLKEIEEHIRKINREFNTNQNTQKRFSEALFILVERLKHSNLIEYDKIYQNVEEAIEEINNIVSQYRQQASNEALYKEFDTLTRKKNSLKYQLRNISNFKKEYAKYKKNLENYKDSLLPIQYIESHFTEVFQCYETKILLNSLSESLNNIKVSYSPRKLEPFEFSEKILELNSELSTISEKLTQLSNIKKPFDAEGEKYMVIGEVKAELKNLINNRKPSIELDGKKLNELSEEKQRLLSISKDSSEAERVMRHRLNDSIQRNYNQINSMPTYENCRTDFFTDDMILKLWRPEELFEIDNVGSKSNYMFMHLCFFLGLHEHMIKVGQVHVPQFLFIDQPSIPYYSDRQNVSNDDRKKLLDAFNLLNSFMKYIVTEKNNDFQIIMVEHAPKEYWKDNNLDYFETVDEFINGNGLIPQYVLNYKENED